MKARIKDLSFDFVTHKQRLVLELDEDFRRKFDEFNGKDLEIDFKIWKPLRSLSANAYMWVLIGKLADAMNLPADEVYRMHIKQCGVWKDFPPLPQREAETLKTVWRQMGKGWIAEQLDYDQDGESVIVRCWYGSSVYTTKQMHRLLSNIVQDCSALGIETLPPDELERLTNQWEGAKI